MPTEEQIKKLAHTIWKEEGQPQHKDKDHWDHAQRILEEQEPKILRPRYVRHCFMCAADRGLSGRIISAPRLELDHRSSLHASLLFGSGTRYKRA